MSGGSDCFTSDQTPFRRTTMVTDVLSRMMDLGLGIAAVTRDKAESLANELIKRGTVSRGEANDLVQDLVERGEHARGQIRESLRSLIEKSLGSMDLPTRSELTRIQQRLDALEAGTTTQD